jgi:hypothetical protein
MEVEHRRRLEARSSHATADKGVFLDELAMFGEALAVQFRRRRQRCATVVRVL